MRNKFGSRVVRETGFDPEGDRIFASHASSPDQLAIVINTENEAAVAFPVEVGGSYDWEKVWGIPIGSDLAATLQMHRENQFDPTPITDNTNFLTVVSDYSERTRILALSGEVLALEDYELSEWLINAERQMTLGIDNHPIFETALEDTACAVRRLPNGLVAMTEVPRRQIEATREQLRSLIGDANISLTNLTIETPIRSVARYFLTSTPEGGATLRAGKESEVTAFLLIGRSGFSYGLWSPFAGLFSEYGFLAPSEISGQKSGFNERTSAPKYEWDAKEQKVSGQAETVKIDKNSKNKRLDAYIRNAFDQLFLQLSPERLEQLQLSNYSQIVWVTEPGLLDTIAPIAEKYAEESGLDFHRIGVSLEEAAAGGLLFGSFSFGDEIVAGAEILPPVNLARDLLILADKEEVERRLFEEVSYLKMRSRAVVALWAAPVMVLACILALTADIVRQKMMLSFRDGQATAQTAELKPALDRRKSYEENLKWYQEFITQVSALRKQQPVGIGMLYELNRNYPFTIDPSFYVSELKLLPNGGVEMKGLARNKDAVTSFLRALEFAGGPESGSRLFSNLTYEVQEGAPPAIVPVGTQTNVQPALNNNSLAPGIIAWNIKGNYLPIAEFLPPDPAKNPVANPATNPAANPAVNPPPPTAPAQ